VLEPVVSVCMPASRSTAAVVRSLESALGQTLRDLEVLLGDDGGHAQEAVDQLGDPRVRYRRNSPPLGFAGNHESLLAGAKGRYVAFLHDDDWWEPTYLEQAVRRLEASPRAGFVLAAHRERPSGALAPHPPAGSRADALRLCLDKRFRFLPSATVMRRTALADVRPSWPRLSCGDMVLYLDAAAAGWGAAILDAPLVSYARHAGQISSDESRFREDLARLFELYRFDDPSIERLRRYRVASSRLSIARTHLKDGRVTEVRADVRRARAAKRNLRTRFEGMALIAMSRRPRLLRATLRAWYAIGGIPPAAGQAGDS
jgi:glycosyltransferase involved in cell wall biosynthesis